MFKRLIIGIGLFSLGYIVGRAVGRSEAELSGHLEWDGDRSAGVVPGQPVEDAEFRESGPDAAAERGSA